MPKLRFWARAMVFNQHESMEEPPQMPPFGSAPKRTRTDSLSHVLSGAAVAITQALRGETAPHTSDRVDLRMKNLEQLRYIKQLLDDLLKSLLNKRKPCEHKNNMCT